MIYKSKNLSEDSTDPYEENLKDICKKNPRNNFVGQSNINSSRNKFDLLAEQIKGIIDVLYVYRIKFSQKKVAVKLLI